MSGHLTPAAVVAGRMVQAVVAGRMVQQALDNAERPHVPSIADATGLSVPEVTALVEKMRAARANGGTRVHLPPPAVGPPEGAPPEDPHELLDWLLGHPDRAVRDAGRTAVTSLRKVAERAHAKAQASREQAAKAARVAQLRAELAQLTARPAPKRTKRPCPDCGELVANLGPHVARSAKHKAAIAARGADHG